MNQLQSGRVEGGAPKWGSRGTGRSPARLAEYSNECLRCLPNGTEGKSLVLARGRAAAAAIANSGDSESETLKGAPVFGTSGRHVMP